METTMAAHTFHRARYYRLNILQEVRNQNPFVNFSFYKRNERTGKTTETNTIYQRSTAICKMHKARVRANNYYWNKLYRKLESEDECDRSGTGKNESNDINS